MSKLAGLTTRSQIGILTAVAVGALAARLLRGRAIPAFEDDQHWNNGRPWPPLGDPPLVTTASETIDLTISHRLDSSDSTSSDTRSGGTRSSANDESTTAVALAVSSAWVTPENGHCPDGYPMKANLKSGIFHRPGGLSYDRTNPDRCYIDAQSAEVDGLRAAKR